MSKPVVSYVNRRSKFDAEISALSDNVVAVVGSDNRGFVRVVALQGKDMTETLLRIGLNAVSECRAPVPVKSKTE